MCRCGSGEGQGIMKNVSMRFQRGARDHKECVDVVPERGKGS